MALSEGYELEKLFTVTESDTAKIVGSGGLDVLATPMLATWVERVAYELLEANLPNGETSVGSKLELRHLSPTPVGMQVTVRLKLKKIDKKRYVFEFTAADEAQRIADGVHERVAVDKKKFMQKVIDKKNESE